MDPALIEALAKLGAVGVLLLVVILQDRRAGRQDALLDKMIERLARIDVRTAEADAAPEPVRPERSRKYQRARTPAPTPFTGGDTPEGGTR